MLPTPLFNNSPRNNCLIQKLFLLFSSQTFVCQWKFIYLLQNKDLHSAFASLKLWWPLLRRDRLERFNLKLVSLNRQTIRQTDRWLNYVEIFITKKLSALCWVFFFHPATSWSGWFYVNYIPSSSNILKVVLKVYKPSFIFKAVWNSGRLSDYRPFLQFT